MLALYRCGRQAEALAAYRQARTALVEAIGAEPGPELRRLHEAILRQDPSLEPPAVEPPGCRPRSTWERRWRDVRRTWSGFASSGAARAAALAGSRWSRARAGSARRGWRPARPPRCIAIAARCSTPRARARRTARWRRWRACGRRGDRRCWCSTTLTTPARPCWGRSASSPARSARCRCSCVAIAADAELRDGASADATLCLAPLDAEAVRGDRRALRR